MLWSLFEISHYNTCWGKNLEMICSLAALIAHHYISLIDLALSIKRVVYMIADYSFRQYRDIQRFGTWSPDHYTNTSDARFGSIGSTPFCDGFSTTTLLRRVCEHVCISTYITPKGCSHGVYVVSKDFSLYAYYQQTRLQSSFTE